MSKACAGFVNVTFLRLQILYMKELPNNSETFLWSYNHPTNNPHISLVGGFVCGSSLLSHALIECADVHRINALTLKFILICAFKFHLVMSPDTGEGK